VGVMAEGGYLNARFPGKIKDGRAAYATDFNPIYGEGNCFRH